MGGAAERPSLRRVLNATGVIVHTNLGRAPLAEAAREAVAAAAGGYSNLELDLSTGARGSRHAHVEALLCALTGAEAALAVNNGAGAALLAAAALAGPGREVVVSRGQLVEIGGGFRVPDVIAQAGARLVEVGTTNRTRLADYQRRSGRTRARCCACTSRTSASSGSSRTSPIESLCELGVPVIDDVGSGALGEVFDEPDVRRSVAAGAALVCFSGDKLLGGPQAGLMVGRAARSRPPARTRWPARCGSTSCRWRRWRRRCGCTATRPREIPVLAMLHASRETLERRAALAAGSRSRGDRGHRARRRRRAAAARAARPGRRPAGRVARRRAAPGDPPLVGRIERGRLLLDPRTLADDEVELAAEAVRRARGGGSCPTACAGSRRRGSTAARRL